MGLESLEIVTNVIGEIDFDSKEFMIQNKPRLKKLHLTNEFDELLFQLRKNIDRILL